MNYKYRTPVDTFMKVLLRRLLKLARKDIYNYQIAHKNDESMWIWLVFTENKEIIHITESEHNIPFCSVAGIPVISDVDIYQDRVIEDIVEMMINNMEWG